MKKQLINITESDLNKIIIESIKSVLDENDDYIRYQKIRNPYDDKQRALTAYKNPIKDGVGLYDIRAKLLNIYYSVKNNRVDDTKKQVYRLYKMVDNMINQGFIASPYIADPYIDSSDIESPYEKI